MKNVYNTSVEGTGTMTITNVFGQTVKQMETNGKETVELSRFLRFPWFCVK